MQILHEQASTLIHSSNVFHNKWAGELAARLVHLTMQHGGLGFKTNTKIDIHTPSAKVFFSNSGTEANEAALKIARRVGKDQWAMKHHGRLWDHNIPSDTTDCQKTGIVCFRNGFHGRTMGALSVTSNPKYQSAFMPLIPGISVGELNSESSLQLITPETCGVIVEPIQGEGGIHSANEEWLCALRRRCDEMKSVLIYDEIQVLLRLCMPDCSSQLMFSDFA